MLFNSLGFLIFFPVCVLVYYAIPKRYQYIWLLAASYYFYMKWNPAYLLLLLFSTAVTYTGGRLIEKAGSKPVTIRDDYRKMCVAASFILNLSVLFIFKYLNMTFDLCERLMSLFGSGAELGRSSLLLPVGISFYTFQALSYTMDVYRGEIKAEKNFLRYALFVSFFPQLVAGPIERSKNLLPQVRQEHSFDYERARDGLYLMLWGYFMKVVVADRIAIAVDSVYDNYTANNGIMMITATVLFAFQIYCDFAGYSTIAIGAAKILGFRLMENFESPYLSASSGEFWRRWHISLSSWFRDYLYIPLGGNRKGKARKYINIMIVFLVSGLWHGAAWHFVVWGGLCGLYQVIGDCLKGSRDKVCESIKLKGRIRKVFAVVFTFILTDFAWLFFRAKSLKVALKMIRRTFVSFGTGGIHFTTALGMNRANLIVMAAGILILMIADIVKYRKKDIRSRLLDLPMVPRCLFTAFVITLILVVGIWGPGYDSAAFIYFQF